MSYLWQAELGQQVYEAAIFYDDGDNSVAQEGPFSYERSERAGEAFARDALRGRLGERPGGFWIRHDPARLRGQPDRGRSSL